MRPRLVASILAISSTVACLGVLLSAASRPLPAQRTNAWHGASAISDRDGTSSLLGPLRNVVAAAGAAAGTAVEPSPAIATVQTDKLAYVASSEVIATGSGWWGGTVVSLTYTEIATTDRRGTLRGPVQVSAVADPTTGTFTTAGDPAATFAPTDQNATITFRLTATGLDASGKSVSVTAATFTSGVTVTTDDNKYALGQPMTISGAGYTPGGRVTVTILRPDHKIDTLAPVNVAPNGSFSTVYTPPLVPGRYKITATDGIYIAKTASTQADAIKVDFKQCANNDPSNTGVNLGECHWINSILQSSNARIFEGMSTLQRMVFDQIPASTNDGNYRMRFHTDSLKATSHAYDFITTWETAIDATDEIAPSPLTQAVPLYPQVLKLRTPAANAVACGDEIPNTGQSPTLQEVCLALRASGNANVTYADLDPANVAAFDPVLGDDVADRLAAYQTRYGAPLYTALGQKHAVKFYSNAAIDAATFTLLGYDAQGNAQWELRWHSTGTPTQLLIEFGAHVAVGTDTIGYGVGYGAGRGAANISGGPYHVSVDLFDFGLASNSDDTSLGSQDNQLKGADILVPPSTPTVVTNVHNASHTNITGTTVPAGTVVHDNVSINTGSSVNVIPAGSTVTFHRYTTLNCTGTPTNQTGVAVPDGAQTGTVESSSFTPTAGSYSYLVDFISGDPTRVVSKSGDPASDCEPFTVASSGVTTQVHDGNEADITSTSVAIGTVVHDRATVDVGTNLTVPAGSTFTFHRYTTLNCTGTVTDETGVPITAGAQTGTAESSTFTPGAAGQFSYLVDFVSGDTSLAANATGVCEPFTVVDANIQITPATDTDPVGHTHTLTVHVNVNPGTGFVNAPAGTSVTVTTVTGPGTISGSPCLTVGVTGSCTVTLTSPTVGTTVINASTTVTVNTVALTRATGDGLPGDSANAQKIWVASGVTTQVHNTGHTDITSTSVAIGTVVHDRATVDVGVGLTVPAGSTFTFHRYTTLTCIGTPTDETGVPITAGAQTGTAESSTFTPGTSGQFSYLVDFVSGDTSLAANATGVCEPFTVVDANIQITPATDTDPVGHTHTLTVHVNVNPGTGFVNAPAGTSVTVTTVTGPGTISGSPCLTVGVTGSCTVTLTSPTVGTTVINASTTVTVNTVALTRATGDGLPGDSANAQKIWVASGVTTQVHNTGHTDITSTSVAIGTVVHDRATVDVGVGLTVPAGSTFTFHRYTTLTCIGTPTDETGVPITAGAQTGTAESSTFTPGTSGQFSYLVDFVSGDTSLAANATGVCEPFTVVDANIQISPLTDTNAISHTHVLTVHVNVNPGTGFVNTPDGTVINVSKTGVGALSASSCTTAGGTGSCTVNLTTTEVGTTTIHGSVDVTVGGVSLHRETDGTGANSGDATKTWVNSSVVTQVHNGAHANITSTTVALGTVVHDSATVDVGAGLTVPTGSTFTFHRYTNLTCTGTPTNQTGVSVPSGSQTGTAESSSFTPTAGPYSYLVDFISGDTSQAASKTGTAATDCEPFTVNPADTGTGTTLHNADHSVIASPFNAAGNSVHDSASVTGQVGAIAITGDVTFRFYATQAACTSDTNFSSGTTMNTVALDAAGVAHPSDAATGLTAGNYAFRARYNGDSNYNTSTSLCEPFFVTTLRIVKDVRGPSATFSYDVTGANTLAAPTTNITPPADGSEDFGPAVINPGSSTISEHTPLPAGYTLTDVSCTGYTGGGTGAGPLDSNGVPTNWNFIAAQGNAVVCSYVNSALQTTRTQGFWSTHTTLANNVWNGVSGFPGATPLGVDAFLCTSNAITATPAAGTNQLMGGFWAAISRLSTGRGTLGQRTALDQARMQLLQQYLAAVLNVHAFGSGSPGMLLSARTAYCGTNIDDIKAQIGILGTFNSLGDSVSFTPGASATSQTSRSEANIPFWDTTFR